VRELRRGRRGKRILIGGEARFEFEGGSITYYASKNCFEAHCGNTEHGRCVLTRHGQRLADDEAPLRFSKTTKKPIGGRPLGFLMAWLSASHDCTRDEHWSRGLCDFDLDTRVLLRAELSLSDVGQALSGYERPKDDGSGEQSEPETLEGYLTGLKQI
jgi:hypothetical protein